MKGPKDMKPEIYRAYLRPARGPMRATLHKYVRTDVVTIPPAAKGLAPTKAAAFIFACEESGAERRWGLEALHE